MAPNPLAVWKAENGFHPMDDDTKVEWAMLARIHELETELSIMTQNFETQAKMYYELKEDKS